MPDKAIDAIDEAASRVRMYKSPIAVRLREAFERLQTLRLKRARMSVEGGEYNAEFEALDAQEQALDSEMEHLRRLQENETGLTVESEDIAEIIAMWTGIPVSQIAQEESRRLMTMETEMHKRIVGQEEAIRSLARAVRRARAGLKDPHRPIGSFIFLGPTGVGKTELAKTLAAFLFGSEEALVQLDMSEFMERHTVARLVGAPPGYVGYDDAGQLTEAVRRRPYSIIVFDEIEKAHPDAFNMLLQVMEEGSLSDAKGRKVDFRNTIIIMTTNVGAEEIQRHKALGFIVPDLSGGDRAYDDMRRKLLEELKKLFRPEFLNRVDDVIVFHALGMPEIRQIVNLEIEKVRERLREQGCELLLTDPGQEWLAVHGYDEQYGARPLRRLIQQEVETPLSEMLLAEGMIAGVTIVVDAGESGLVLRRAEQPEGVVKP
jgi:ATP-dependent Clp protease ATP-binding subunit ClpC